MALKLSHYIEGVAAKRLSAVEADVDRSNQHELNGVSVLKRLLGEDRKKFQTQFLFLADQEEGTSSVDGFVTWYDSREQDESRTAEYRLYFPSSPVSESMSEGDLVAITKLTDGRLLMIAAESGSTAENQIQWLFGLSDDSDKFEVKDISVNDNAPLSMAARLILDAIGVSIEETDEGFLEILQERFGGKFPTTRVFSSFARETLPEVSSIDSADEALLAWYEREELLFRTMERHLVSERLIAGFEDDVDGFVKFSLSVHNRRKSRAGYALENHFEQILMEQGLRYSRGKQTEKKAKPDFIFPDISNYHDMSFPEARLTMLGAKTSAKDRWRQVLPEAKRVKTKHLLTLEPSISVGQTDEMIEHRVQLVIPTPLHQTYSESQRDRLMEVGEFVEVIRARQS